MVKLAPRRTKFFMLPIMMGIIFFLSSCGSAASTVGVTYKPPFAPVTFTIDSNGTISVQGNLSIDTTPIPTSLPPTPTPLPYPVSKTGDVCQPPFSQFQTSGWVAVKNSFVFTGNGSNVVISPCNTTTPNYSVTATIRLLIARSSPLGVGVIAHADSGGQTGYAGGSGCRNISFGRCGFFINDHFGDIMGIDLEANLAGQTHTYKLVIDGITLQLFYDNNSIPIVSKSLATYPQAGLAGFECYDQCEVTSYTVTGI